MGELSEKPQAQPSEGFESERAEVALLSQVWAEGQEETPRGKSRAWTEGRQPPCLRGGEEEARGPGLGKTLLSPRREERVAVWPSWVSVAPCCPGRVVPPGLSWPVLTPSAPPYGSDGQTTQDLFWGEAFLEPRPPGAGLALLSALSYIFFPHCSCFLPPSLPSLRHGPDHFIQYMFLECPPRARL